MRRIRTGKASAFTGESGGEQGFWPSYAVQTESAISNDYLEHKELSFKFDSFGDGKTYYCVWCYTDKLPSLDDLKEITSNLSTDSVG